MKAVVKYGQNDGEVELREVPEPVIGPGDVLFEVRAAGVCGWDIEMWRHTMANPVTAPVIQGHEFAGVIRAIGSAVRGYKAGDRVVSETAAVICGVCRECRSGNYNLCPERKGFGYGVDGAFTSLVKVPARCLHSIPDEVNFEQACMTEPACVAYQALAVLSDVEPGRPLLIIGPGPVGLFSLQVAKACGAGSVIVVGTPKDSARFEVARGLGADVIVDVSKDDPSQIVMNLTGGQGVPLVVDAVGNEQALALALKTVARRGQITKIGWGPKPASLSLDLLISKSARLQGTFSHTWSTWEAVLSMIGRNTIDMGPMISHRFALEDWREAYGAVESCRAIKAVFIMDGASKL